MTRLVNLVAALVALTLSGACAPQVTRAWALVLRKGKWFAETSTQGSCKAAVLRERP